MGLDSLSEEWAATSCLKTVRFQRQQAYKELRCHLGANHSPMAVTGALAACYVDECLLRFRTCRGGLSCRGPQLSGTNWVNVQRIDFTPEVVHQYTIADVQRLDRPDGEQILHIDSKGVAGNLTLDFIR